MDRTINEFGFWSGLTASAFTLAFITVQVLQMLGVIGYPRNEILI